MVDHALGEDAIRSRQESVQMIERWNSGTQDYPDRSCLHEMFRESAKKNHDAPAIFYKVWVSAAWRVVVVSVLLREPEKLAGCSIERGLDRWFGRGKRRLGPCNSASQGQLVPVGSIPCVFSGLNISCVWVGVFFSRNNLHGIVL